jgi:hypothetical protein
MPTALCPTGNAPTPRARSDTHQHAPLGDYPGLCLTAATLAHCAWTIGIVGEATSDAGAAPTVHAHTPGLGSAAASPLVWGAAPDTACGWGATAPWRVVQACVNSAPKNTIRAE